MGAHANPWNTRTFGVMVMGDYMSETMTEDVHQGLVRAIAWAANTHDFGPAGTLTRDGYEVNTVIGHRDVPDSPEDQCPGQIGDDLDSVRSDAGDRLFPDVPHTFVHYSAIIALGEMGIIDGDANGMFDPGAILNCGQMATILASAVELTPTDTSSFPDVPADHPHHDGIAALEEADIIQGDNQGNFNPQNDVVRDQMATFLANSFGFESNATTSRFDDVPEDNVHLQAIEAIADAGVAEGCDAAGQLFCPRDSLARDQTATFVHRALD